MPGPRAKQVKLPRKLRKRLLRWARSQKQPHRRVMRAKIALLAEDVSDREEARKSGEGRRRPA
jgi:hypothetical protein